jgi:hypothetical protein
VNSAPCPPVQLTECAEAQAKYFEHCRNLGNARKEYGLKLFRYLRSGTPLGSDCPAVFLAARSSVKANLHAAEAWYLASKVKDHLQLSRQALANDDPDTAAKHLRKAKEIDAQRVWEEKEADKLAENHLRALKNAMNTAKKFEGFSARSLEQMLCCEIEKQKANSEKVKAAQKEALWNKSKQLEQEYFSTQNLCHAPPAGQQHKKNLSSSKSFINLRKMTGGCST